jgi:hypothetical protein
MAARVRPVTRKTSLTFLMFALGLAACGDDGVTPGDTEGTGTDTGTSSMTMTTMTTTMTMTTMADTTADDTSSTGAPTDDTSSDGGSSEETAEPPPPMPVDVCVRIENISDQGLLTTPFSPGVWANHDAANANFFTPLAARPGEGLELLAENGDPSELADAIPSTMGFLQTGVFDTPVGGAAPAPILPGESYEFTFTADPCPVGSDCADNDAPFTRLSLAMMLGASNDLIVATGTNGVGLFNGNGSPMGIRDITDSLAVWDVGTEANQAPGQGPNQAPFSGVDVGPSEAGEVGAFASSTRAIPLAEALVTVEVDQGDGVETPADEYTFTIANVSGAFGTLVTPLSGAVWATHDDTFALFDEGGTASAELESLAEDGDTSGYEASLGAAAGVDQFAAVAGPFTPGDSITFTVTPTADGRFLSFATMLGETNDAFLSMAPAGVALLEEDGSPRDDEDIEADILATLGAWDAGTEANEVPGVGLTQAPRQVAPGDGLADGDPTVRRYIDVTNDLAGESLGGFVSVVVENAAAGAFDVTITNSSDTTAYPGALSPVVWALHDDTVTMFEVGAAASAGLEELAEDGDGDALETELEAAAGVAIAAVEGVAPLLPGASITFTVTPSAAERFLSLAAMVAPSNDTFMAFAPEGIALLDAAGVERTDEDIAADIAAALSAWDAGTENNQGGALGSNMAPLGMPNTGAGEGSGVVRDAEDDTVWPVPAPANIVRVTVGPAADLCQ